MDWRLVENTYDRISAVAQCRDPDTIMEIVDQVAASVGAKRHALLRFASANGGRNRFLPPWDRSPIADLFVSAGFDVNDPLQRAIVRLRRPVTDKIVSQEERQDAGRLARFLAEAGVGSFVAVPIFQDAAVTAGFSLYFPNETPSEAAWVAGALAPALFDQVLALAAAPAESEHTRAANPLTPRELECLIWSADGKTSWEISEILDVSERTVNAHLGRTIRKLGVVSRTQAVAEAIRRGLFR